VRKEGLIFLVKRDMKRERKRFYGALWSIFIATSLMFLLLSLGLAIRGYVIEKILSHLPSNQVTVKATPNTLLGVSFSSSKSQGLKERHLKEFKSWHEVNKVYRVVDACFPMHAYGRLLGKMYGSDAVLVGYDEDYLGQNEPWAKDFIYKEGEQVPVVASTALLEIYNEAFASANNLPRITEKDVLGRELFLVLGRNSLREAEKHQPFEVKGVVTGFSPLANVFGANVPIDYVVRWNRVFGQRETIYSALILEVSKPEYVDIVVQKAKDMGLRVESNLELSRRLTTLVRVIIGVLLLLGLLFLLLSTFNIISIFRLIVGERKREIALFRSLGARINDIVLIFITESALLGLLGSLLGLSGGMVFALIAEKYLLQALPSFPFKPQYIFQFSPVVAVFIIFVTMFFCIASPLSIFLKVARKDPAQQLG